MANYTTCAINLKSYNLGEADKIIVMYSKDYGIIRCVAKGVRKPVSKFGGRMEMLVANKLLIAKGKKLDIICQAESVDTFKEIRRDIAKLTHSIYCAELINTFGLENDTNSSKIYEIFFESLKNISLSSAANDILWTTIRFQLRLMKQLGYAVELDTCVKCNNSVENSSMVRQNYFCAESGGIVCGSCKSEFYGTVDITPNVVKILKDAMNFDFPEDEALYNKDSQNQIKLSTCFNILKEYISVRSHKKLKTPELIECLC